MLVVQICFAFVESEQGAALGQHNNDTYRCSESEWDGETQTLQGDHASQPSEMVADETRQDVYDEHTEQSTVRAQVVESMMNVGDVSSLEDVCEESHEDRDCNQLDDAVDQGGFTSGRVCLDDDLLGVIFHFGFLLLVAIVFGRYSGCSIAEVDGFLGLGAVATEVPDTMGFW